MLGGLTLGIGLSVAASKTMRSVTNAEANGSPAMYAAVVLFFAVVTLLATYPARAPRQPPGYGDRSTQ